MYELTALKIHAKRSGEQLMSITPSEAARLVTKYEQLDAECRSRAIEVADYTVSKFKLLEVISKLREENETLRSQVSKTPA